MDPEKFAELVLKATFGLILFIGCAATVKGCNSYRCSHFCASKQKVCVSFTVTGDAVCAEPNTIINRE